MAIADLAKTPPPAVEKGPSCAVCRALKELPEADAEGLTSLMGNPEWTFKAIAKAVADDPDLAPEHAWVKRITHGTYGRHATEGCAARVRLRASKQ